MLISHCVCFRVYVVYKTGAAGISSVGIALKWPNQQKKLSKTNL